MRGLLVGYGSIGRRHLANLHQLGVTDWAVVHTGKGTLHVEPPCPIRTYAHLSEALREERPTFAVIANPTSLHIPTAVACASAGCHLLVEKPISHASTDTDALRRATALSGTSVLVGFQFRFDAALIRISRASGVRLARSAAARQRDLGRASPLLAPVGGLAQQLRRKT